jgi:hypothetical protein
MSKVSVFLAVASITGAMFWRCGHQFSPEGEVFAPDAFTDAEWEVILADPWLKVSPAEAPADRDEEAEVEAALDAAVLNAIANLAPDGFGQDGKPSVAALKTALPDQAGAITAAVRDRVWEGAKASDVWTQPDAGQSPPPPPAS